MVVPTLNMLRRTGLSLLVLQAAGLGTGCGMLASLAGQPVRDAVTTVPYHSRDGLVIVDVRLPDGESYPFMLDTGFSTSVVDRDLVERLQLRRRGKMRMYDFQEHSGRVGVHGLKTMSIGDVEFRDVGVVALDGGWNGVTCEEPFAGIIGSNILARGAVEIDGQRHLVHLAAGDAQLPQRPAGTRFEFSQGHWYPHVQVPIAGRSSAGFLFDTGNGTTIDIQPSVAASFRPSTAVRCVSETSSWGLFGPQTDTPQPCRAFVWPHDVAAPPLNGLVARDANTNMFGAGLLEYFTVRVDYKAGAVTMWRNDRAIEPEFRTYGVDFACDEVGKLFVGTVWERSGAAEAGIEEGQEATAIVADGAVIPSPCGCDSPCGCGRPVRAIEHAEVVEVTFASRADAVRLAKTDLLAELARPRLRPDSP